MPDLTWVQQTQTVQATDPAVAAIEANPGWKLIATGQSGTGETLLTYGWPWTDEWTDTSTALPALGEPCWVYDGHRVHHGSLYDFHHPVGLRFCDHRGHTIHNARAWKPAPPPPRPQPTTTTNPAPHQENPT